MKALYVKKKLMFDSTTTIEFKKNYQLNKQILQQDLKKLYQIIEETLKKTKNIYIFGCSIFRKISQEELNEINQYLLEHYELQIKVVSQSDEAFYTAYGCYADIDYDKEIYIFIGGGGSIELLFVKNKEVIEQKYYDFGVVDVTNQFPSLKKDYNTCS